MLTQPDARPRDKEPENREPENWADYLAAGEARARALPNRGPLRLDAAGELHADILAAYRRTGMYIFEGLVQPEELSELKSDLNAVIDRLPAGQELRLDRHGNAAIGADLERPFVFWSKPLGDPLGGTNFGNGRHPVKMFEPAAAAGSPAEIPFTVTGVLQFSDAALRVYGHPGLLSIAAAVNGADFVPYNEALIIKQPGQGASFAWHQDGMTHWTNPDWDAGIHGFNFMVQLYGCTAANGLWYIPGSHENGKYDIRGLIARAGGNFLPGAVPLICNPGDVAISNRQLVHASFPNTGSDIRVTLNIGFHRRAAVLGSAACGIDGDMSAYDAEWIRERAEMIGYAIDARRRHFPAEKQFAYQPHMANGEQYRFDGAAREKIRQYNLRDLVI